MVLKRLTGILNRQNSHDDSPIPNDDSPEAVAGRAVRLFCESGGPSNGAEEIQYLPSIVDAAESSPGAAATCAHQIRKFLVVNKDTRPHVQYNAIMLIRILADNPGPTFTRNLDKKFADTVKDLLRNGRDPSVQQILRETLRALWTEKAYDQNLAVLFQMWQKEPGGMQQARYGGQAPVTGRVLAAPGWESYQPPPATLSHNAAQGSYGRPRKEKGLPPPVELAARIEEAKTSAKLLLQLIQSSTPSELLANDLVKEFSERCQAAQRSVQGYINCDEPAPDDATMQTLIETSEQLSLAINKHQRAIMNARKATGRSEAAPPEVGGFYGSGVTPPSKFIPQGPRTNTVSSAENTTGLPSTYTAYEPPVGPPPSTFSPPGPATYVPTPPTGLQANLDRRNSPPDAEKTLVPGLNAPYSNHEAAEMPTDHGTYFNPNSNHQQTHEDPFSDDYDTTYGNHHQPNSQNYPAYQPTYQPYSQPNSNEYSAPAIPPRSSGRSDYPAPEDRETLEQGMKRMNLTTRESSFGGAPQSYHPGFKSTPSYLHRQESALENLTMRGAASPPTPAEERTHGSIGGMSMVSEVSEGGRDRGMSPVAEGGVSPIESRSPERRRR